ncbi:hypothetical protein [Uliginosibacterium gangwonense]|uniref:hypothetical protein n=1 Tax=Uliginosibacterium gangwonense TaxID=392736 RepID=UPI00035E431F|nr:hypothetical protein [Uliginosibacterium gangwonense]
MRLARSVPIFAVVVFCLATLLAGCASMDEGFSGNVQQMINKSQRRESYMLYSYTMPVFDDAPVQPLCVVYAGDSPQEVGRQRLYYAMVDFRLPQQNLQPVSVEDKVADARLAAPCTAQVRPQPGGPGHRIIVLQQQNVHALSNAEVLAQLGPQGGRAYIFVTPASEVPGGAQHSPMLYMADDKGIISSSRLNMPGRVVVEYSNTGKKIGAYALYPLAIVGDVALGTLQLILYVGMARVWPNAHR